MQHRKNPLIIRLATVPLSLHKLLKGQMKYMQNNGFSVHLISSNGPEIGAVIANEGCGFTTINMTRAITPMQDLMSLIRLCYLFFKMKPDIVHTHTPKAGFLGMVAATIVRVPVKVHTIAGLPWTETKGFKRAMLKKIEKWTISMSTCIHVNSMNLLNFIKTQQLDSIPSKLKVLGNGSSNGIDTNYFSREKTDIGQVNDLLRLAGVETGGFIWLFVGRIVKEKGIAELVDAYLQVKLLYPQDQLWMVGPAEKRDHLDSQLDAIIAKEKNIIRWGYHDDVRPFFAAADTLVFPSYREGFPNVPMQAAAMECPMILSDINGCNEIVQNKVNGILVPVKNAASLTDGMLLLRENPALRKYYAERSLVIVKEKYSDKKIWSLLEAEYKGLLISNKH